MRHFSRKQEHRFKRLYNGNDEPMIIMYHFHDFDSGSTGNHLNLCSILV